MTRRERITYSATAIVVAPFIGYLIDQVVKGDEPIPVGGIVTATLATYAITTLLGSIGESGASEDNEVPQAQD
jgi:hypothetical protein